MGFKSQRSPSYLDVPREIRVLMDETNRTWRLQCTTSHSVGALFKPGGCDSVTGLHPHSGSSDPVLFIDWTVSETL